MSVIAAKMRGAYRGNLFAVLTLSLLAWAALVARNEAHVGIRLCASSTMAAFAAAAGAAMEPRAVWATVCDSSLMLIAMMLPLLGPTLAQLDVRTLHRRRYRARCMFLFGYATAWLIALAVLTMATAAFVSVGRFHSDGGVAITIGLAVLWQGTLQKRRYLNRCHVLQALPAFGLRAEVDTLTCGARVGVSCVGACWALMAVPFAIADGHIAAMSGVASVMVWERYARRRPARAQPLLMGVGAVLILLGLVCEGIVET